MGGRRPSPFRFREEYTPTHIKFPGQDPLTHINHTTPKQVNPRGEKLQYSPAAIPQ